MANLKCVGQANRLETKARVSVAVLSLVSVGQANRLETWTGCSLESNFCRAGWKFRQGFYITVKAEFLLL